MRILHAIFSLGRHIGGPARSVQGLVAALGAIEPETWLMSLKPNDSAWNPEVKNFWKGSDPYEALIALKPDIVHVHGIWLLPVHRMVVAARKLGIPYVIAPRGSLDDWSMRQRWLKKQIALALYQRCDLVQASALHVTSEMEAQHCRRLGFGSRFIYSPNGVNLPGRLPESVKQLDGNRHMLFLSRIHPKKGLIELVRAWAAIPHSGWKLDVVGNDTEGYWPTVQNVIDQVCPDGSIVRIPFQDDQAKWKTYCSSDCFVLPTHTENFGIVVAEALCANLPVITTTNAPWKGLIDNDCGWWIDLNETLLAETMRKAMGLSDSERAAMGSRGRNFVQKEFAWDAIARRMLCDYNEILG